MVFLWLLYANKFDISFQEAYLISSVDCSKILCNFLCPFYLYRSPSFWRRARLLVFNPYELFFLDICSWSVCLARCRCILLTMKYCMRSTNPSCLTIRRCFFVFFCRLTQPIVYLFTFLKIWFEIVCQKFFVDYLLRSCTLGKNWKKKGTEIIFKDNHIIF